MAPSFCRSLGGPVAFGVRPGDSERCQTPTLCRAPSRPRAGRDRFHRARDARTARASPAGWQSPGRYRQVRARPAKIAPVKTGVTIPNNWGIDDPRQVLALGPLAEALGYDSIWVMDHLLNCGYIRERLDDRPYYHPLATLSYLAATTRQVRLGTSVLVLPYHNPVEPGEVRGDPRPDVRRARDPGCGGRR